MFGNGRPFSPVVTVQGQSSSASFRSTVDVVALDVQVVRPGGEPVLDLSAPDFRVWINNRLRRVLSAEIVNFARTPLSLLTAGTSDVSFTLLQTPGFRDSSSRIYILAIDESTLNTLAGRSAIEAARQFVSRLRPEDLVGLYRLPFSVPVVDLTHDHTAVRLALQRVRGQRDPLGGEFMMTLPEMVDISASDAIRLREVSARECDRRGGDQGCPDRVRNEALAKTSALEMEAARSVYALNTLIAHLGSIPGPKTVIYVSGGIPYADRAGARPDSSSLMRTAGDLAAQSRVNLYAMHLDTSDSDATSNAAEWRIQPNKVQDASRDRRVRAAGLERLADAAGGAFLSLPEGNGNMAFARVLSETSAFYLVGVAPEPADYTGASLYLRVAVNAKPATVRYRKQALLR